MNGQSNDKYMQLRLYMKFFINIRISTEKLRSDEQRPRFNRPPEPQRPDASQRSLKTDKNQSD